MIYSYWNILDLAFRFLVSQNWCQDLWQFQIPWNTRCCSWNRMTGSTSILGGPVQFNPNSQLAKNGNGFSPRVGPHTLTLAPPFWMLVWFGLFAHFHLFEVPILVNYPQMFSSQSTFSWSDWTKNAVLASSSYICDFWSQTSKPWWFGILITCKRRGSKTASHTKVDLKGIESLLLEVGKIHIVICTYFDPRKHAVFVGCSFLVLLVGCSLQGRLHWDWPPLQERPWCQARDIFWHLLKHIMAWNLGTKINMKQNMPKNMLFTWSFPKMFVLHYFFSTWFFVKRPFAAEWLCRVVRPWVWTSDLFQVKGQVVVRCTHVFEHLEFIDFDVWNFEISWSISGLIRMILWPNNCV